MISFVIPCYCSSATLPAVEQEIRTAMTLRGEDWELILVNDCSPDQGETMQTIRKLCEERDNVTGIGLARNFGQHAALMAGFRMVSGDVVVCLDDDGQTPADEVGKLLDKIAEGYDAVYARYAQKQHSLFRNFGSAVNEAMAAWLLDKPKELYVSSYFAVRRFIVDEMVRYHNPYPYVIGLVLRSTKSICNVDVNHRARVQGTSGYTLRKLLNLWLNGFTSFSVKPLRVATTSGAALAAFGFLYAVYTVINKIINPAVPAGWSSLICAMMIIGGMMMVMLGLVGEYVGRIYISLNNAPQYVVREVCGKHDDPASQQNGYNC